MNRAGATTEAMAARPARAVAPDGSRLTRERAALDRTVLDRTALDRTVLDRAPVDRAVLEPASGDHALVDRAAVELVARCDAELVAAQLATDPADRFLHAHLAALRLAGALLLASGARPPRGRPRSAWDRLAAAVPGCASWATFFTSGARIRAALDAGADSVDDEFAATWVAAAEDFRDAVCVQLGIDPYADLRSTMAWAS